MKIYKPNDLLEFGKNKGVKLSSIYKYQPSYIEWAIENIPDFKINIGAFEALPNPTPGNYNKESFSNEEISKPPEDLSVDDFFELIKRSDTINQLKNTNVDTWNKMESNQTFESIDYKFPDRIKILNNKK